MSVVEFIFRKAAKVRSLILLKIDSASQYLQEFGKSSEQLFTWSQLIPLLCNATVFLLVTEVQKHTARVNTSYVFLNWVGRFILAFYISRMSVGEGSYFLVSCIQKITLYRSCFFRIKRFFMIYVAFLKGRFGYWKQQMILMKFY